MKLRQSDIAAQAIKCVERAQRDRQIFAEYGTRANSFPSMIVQVGIAQALGFLRAKSGHGNTLERAYDQYYHDLLELARIAIPEAPSNAEGFYNSVLQAELGEYRRLSQIILDASVWLKRICQGADHKGVEK
ncbi:type III-B CRISPR module-associated protein Cmr5 [Acidithiobacillus caldus]|jgi:CRISPR-associated protein Cmr5|uniref:CRISPR type III-B/RAMP module-associated protein Cmr5 n=1 Tax=Acidithiobacillus caldus TaxID=33059 RepID=A0A1E7YKZ6_9PROT|nr:type III-B CRISPR module-associated protein Cmr5 [Acidithiobacillus caldus]OFC30541.1 type III-B CRISPR module-associated protein Cmr5 [Acidithiobacillus caldus]OFC36806.1 type III-B CRISPR module-associated protein Cmr5 [Acidithiobacillus caldus]OFC41759.1 type III-B CRISPR module-associated protein Cmr5 [Acidithiobacillus caldus]